MSQLCEHFESLTEPVRADGPRRCQQCVDMGDTWVHLRACLICGQIGCCDQSKNTHARKHWEEHGHPLIQSAELGETWRFCYPDELFAP